MDWGDEFMGITWGKQTKTCGKLMVSGSENDKYEFFHIYETLTGVQLLNNYGSNFQGENYGSCLGE